MRANYRNIFWDGINEHVTFLFPKNLLVTRTDQNVIRVCKFVRFQNRTKKSTLSSPLHTVEVRRVHVGHARPDGCGQG